MSTVVIAINVTGTPDVEDRRAMQFMIDRENQRRSTANVEIAQENARKAALDPPEAPSPLIALLPFSTGAERKSSIEVIYADVMRKAHLSYIRQANEAAAQSPAFQELKPLWADATPEKKAAAIAALQ